MGSFCRNITLQLNQTCPILELINVNVSSFLDVCDELEDFELDSAKEAKYSEPMVLIGMCIAFASMICFEFMLLDGFIDVFIFKKFWIPFKSFALNASSLIVITLAMKIPMDLTSPMPDEIDQVVKVGSLGFLCIIMSNLLPSLAVIDNKSLWANVTALSILVITLVVNVSIQIVTQVIEPVSYHPFSMPPIIAAYIYMGMLLFLLIIFISSAIAIPTLKKVLELKYRAILNYQNLQENLIFSVEELRQLVKRHWIMAVTGSPEFMMASTPLSSASSVICTISMVVYISLSWHAWVVGEIGESVYQDSTMVIFVILSMGVVSGTVISVYRCFAVLRFKAFANQSSNHFSVFKVEKYWTQRLCEWKENPVNWFNIREFFYYWFMKNCILHILSVCIVFQKVIVVLCKMLELIPISVIIFVTYCSYYFKSLKALLVTPPTASSSEDADEGLSNYVLSLEDNEKIAKYSSERVLDSMNSWSRHVKRYLFVKFNMIPQINDLLKVVEKSVSFEGVEMFDIDQIQSVLSIELVNSWSLPIISLTSIAIALSNIDKDVVDDLLKSVGKGLFYTLIVEKNLNKTSEYVNIQRASVILWREVIEKHKWLDITLKRNAYEGKTPIEIIKLFAYSSEETLNEFNTTTNGVAVENDNIPWRVLAANSMYRIAHTILHRYESNNLEIIEDELFTRLSNMIADILVACLINIPRVIVKICHEKAIEKRERSVMLAVSLLGETSEIIKRLETRQLPNMDPEKMGFIDEWRLHFKQP